MHCVCNEWDDERFPDRRIVAVLYFFDFNVRNVGVGQMNLAATRTSQLGFINMKAFCCCCFFGGWG